MTLGFKQKLIVSPILMAAAFALIALVACGAPIEDEVTADDTAPPTTRPNVLFICVDDLRPELLACGARSAVSRVTLSGSTARSAAADMPGRSGSRS